jgi:putative addiction module killer protein
VIHLNMNEREVKRYILENGEIPFDNWYRKLDNSLRIIVAKRINRLSIGLYGDCKTLAPNLKELRFKNGLRVYFTEDDNTIILLLTGGNKSRQSDDIKKAQQYLQNHIERIKNAQNK